MYNKDARRRPARRLFLRIEEINIERPEFEKIKLKDFAIF